MTTREWLHFSKWALGLGMLTFSVVACGGGGGPTSTPPPPTQPTTCGGVPATSNPPGGGGTPTQIQIDPNTYGTGNISRWTAVAFSQNNPGDPADQEILDIAPDLVPRGFGKWDRGGLLPTDYNFAYPAAAEAEGVTFIGGTTATVLFSDEPNFQQVVSCDASGQPVFHSDGGFYRGALASPLYQQYLIGIGEVQIDGGVDGVFFDEVDASYEGANFDGDEGFDDADVADFGGFLCAKYPNLTPAQWAQQYLITSADNLNCSLSAAQRGRGFHYRQYLARNGWTGNPLTPANPLAAEWGTIPPYTWPTTAHNTFVETYPYLVYWQNVVVALRNYARQKYNKEIYVTANGPFHFADFQTIGFWDYNPDAPDGTDVNWVPVTSSGSFDGTVSWQAALQGILQRAQSNGKTNVPVVLFIDWPTSVMSRYYGLPSQGRQDYIRVFTAEAYANGLYFSLPVKTSIFGDPTAASLGMIPLFEQLTSFYKAHSNLYHGAQTVTGAAVTVSASSLMKNLTTLADGSTVLHLVNHNYSLGFAPQNNIVVSFPAAQQPAAVTLVSPDLSQDTPVAFTYSGGQVRVIIPQLLCYVAVVAK